MRALRRRAFTFVVPLVLSLVLGVPVAFATFTTGTFKTIGGGFLGGTVPNATTFSAGVTFNAQANFNATVQIPSVVGANGSRLTVGTAGSNAGGIAQWTDNTPDAPVLETGTTSNSWQMRENSDRSFDFNNGSCGTSACTDPSLIIYSHNQSTTQWLQFNHDGTNGVVDVGAGGVSFPDSILGKNGTVSSPAYNFLADVGTGTGFYLITNAQVGVTNQGTPTVDFTTLGPRTGSGMFWGFSSNADPGAAGPDSGLARVTTNVVKPVGATTGTNGWLQQVSGELALNANYTNNTATFSNTNLSATVISGRTYSFDLNLFVSNSTAAEGVKIDFNGGSAAATNFRVSCFATNDTTAATVAFTAATATALATTINIAALASTGNHLLACKGSFVPSGAGTFILRAAENSTATGTLTIARGSILNVRDANPL